MRIILSYPNPALSPNRANGKHWSSTRKLKDAASSEAYLMTKSLIASKPNMPDENIAIDIKYVQSDKRRRDLDNLLAASKASLDGVARALNVDDKNFSPITISREYGEEARMEITILRACAIFKRGKA